VDEATLPASLRVCARTEDDGEIMAIIDDERALFGVQFHPESIATEYGEQFLMHFIDQTRRTS
jgi:anthranilate synthase component 2